MEMIQKRIEGLERWLAYNAPESIDDQRHLDEGTAERAYWHYGYICALRDIKESSEGIAAFAVGSQD